MTEDSIVTDLPYRPGLEGVPAGITALSQIDVERNVLTYRGYNVQELCDNCSFEETAWLLLFGDLPNSEQLRQFNARLDSLRGVPHEVYGILKLVPRDAEPMDWLKLAVTSLALYDPDPHSQSREANMERAVRITACMPLLVANGYRITQGMEPVTAPPGLGTADLFLRTLTGDAPNPYFVTTLNTTLILYAEHGFNAGTFAARVTVSTLSDLYSGVVSAIGALKGSLHGGANEEVMKMLLEIGNPQNALQWLDLHLAKTPTNPRPRVMGFGHREYKRGDQRAQIVRGYTRHLAELTGEGRWTAIADVLEVEMLQRKGLYPNLDFPVSPAYYLMGLPIPLYTPIFVISRIVGWCAHIVEQLGNNRLIRPTNLYNGNPPRQFIPISQRPAGGS